MAEERLIDEDKDRKYKIRKNADGDDELYIDESEPEEVQEEEMYFAADDEDEEQELLTPEQIEARSKLREEAEKKRKEALYSHIEKIKELLDTDYYGAIDEAVKAEEFDDGDAEFAVYKLLAYSRSLTDFQHEEEISEATEVIEEYASEEQKYILREKSQGLKEQVKTLREETKKISEENERGKTERREIFRSRRNNALIFFCCVFASLVVFTALACVFGSMIYAVKDSHTNLILTIVFGVLAGICFIVSLIALNKLWTAQRRVRLNESDLSTKIGREFIAKTQFLEMLERVYFSFSDHDIS